MYKCIWHGQVDTKELKDCDPQKKINLQGPQRCCLTDKTMVFMPLDSYGGCNVESQNHVELAIASIRACGHKDNVFFMEPGRSSGIGRGQLKFELDDHAIAENMHTTMLEIWNPAKSDETRPRAYTSASGSVRLVNNHRSRQNYWPPPSQVGLGKPAVSTGPKKDLDNRTRCGSFPTSRLMSEDARIRAASEGESAMRQYVRYASAGEADMRRFRSSNPALRNGSTSPHPRFKQRSFQSLSSAPHSRTSSLPGSVPGSTSSSQEQISGYVINDGRSSSDEYTISKIPPPPSDLPPNPPISSLLQHYPHSCHSRSHSFDGNSSISASSLSTSPYTGNDMSAGTSPSQDGSFLGGSSPTKEVNGRAGISMFTSDYEPMSFPNHSREIASDYICMNPASVSGCSEDGNGYVPMLSLNHSRPQEIVDTRHTGADNKLYPGTYSHGSPSRSPDKHHHNRRHVTNGISEGIFPHNFPNYSGTSPFSHSQKSRESTSNGDVAFSVSQNGHLSKLSPNDSVYSNDYASMDDFLSCSSNDLSASKSPIMDHEYVPCGNDLTSAKSSSMYHEYVPMKGVVVGNVIAIAQSSRTKSNASQIHSQRYPHEISSNRDRTAAPRRRNTVSSAISSHWSRNVRMAKHGRRGSTRLDSKSSDSPPPSPGGEYVSIDYDRARQQVGAEYISLTEPELDSECSHSEDSNHMTKVTHDSNRNILPNVESTVKDEN